MATDRFSSGKIVVSILLVLLGLLGLFMTVCGLVFIGAGMAGVSILSMVIGIAFIVIAARSFSSADSNGDDRRRADPPS